MQDKSYNLVHSKLLLRIYIFLFIAIYICICALESYLMVIANPVDCSGILGVLGGHTHALIV
nr:MAG TPA: hypothetical protein [Inoviridae sp.]